MSSIEQALRMAQLKNSVVDYLTEQLEINSNSLKQYETDTLLPNNTPAEIVRMREVEAIKLRDRIHELTRHISAIKRIIPIEYEEQPERTKTKAGNPSGRSKPATAKSKPARTTK